MITIEHLSKTFHTAKNEIHAVRDVSLKIAPGEIFGIMGTSGAGKSTLVRCLNILETPDAGTLRIEGFGQITFKGKKRFLGDETKHQPLKEKHLRQLRLQTGMIFQHFNLLDRRSVADNIAYPLQHSGKSRKEIEEKIDELLHLVHLEDKKDAYPAQLSGGQKQRVAIARALARDPAILLCDEATSALDPQATETILSLLKELNERLHLTIVLITHEMDVIKSIAHRAAVMENGRVVECGSVYDLFVHPHHPLTRRFVSRHSKDQTEQGISSPVLCALEKENGTLLRLNFDSRSLSQPVIFEMIRTFGIPVNILEADIDRIGGQPFGTLLFETSASKGQISSLQHFLQENHVETEVLSYA